MKIQQFVKFSAEEWSFPEEMNVNLQRQLHLSANLFQQRHVKSTIRFVVTAPSLKRPGKSILFHAFATNRTAYGTIHDLRVIFADWFLKTGILPIINPIPIKYYYEAEMLPRPWLVPISKRGVRIYSYVPST